MTRRILSRVENPKAVAPELDWVNSWIRLLNDHFTMVSRSIDLIKDGSMMIVVQIEELPDHE